MIGDLRFTKVIQLACLALLSAIGFHPSALFAQGSLTPPGPPGATMLTLSQIEPRTPISSGGFIITAPGSYCLTTNLVCTNTFGIETFANNITLDLNGFSLTGTSGAEFGIYVVSGSSRIRVYNGMVNGWANYGIASAANDITLEHLAISGNTIGVVLSGSFGNTLRDSTVDGNTNYGVWCDQCSATLDDLVVSSNGNLGIYFQQCANDAVKDCTVDGNGSHGVDFSSTGNGIISDSAINENNGFGIDCTSSTNVNLERLTILDNNTSGINFSGSGCIISACGINGNNQDGILMAGSGCFIHDNNCAGNADGIYVTGSNNRIENNHIIENGGTGLAFEGLSTNNLVVKNSVEGSGTYDYFFNSPQITGPIITNAISGIITNSSPWANFGF